jgi:hypothetical protein
VDESRASEIVSARKASWDTAGIVPFGSILAADACARQESGKTYMIIICIVRGHRIAC